MKKFNAGDLSKKPSEVFEAARADGALIQHKDRRGNVVEEFVMLKSDSIEGDPNEIIAFNKPITEFG